MKNLIINSDDYGRSPDISRGIRAAHLNGVVTSTTCMLNIPTTVTDIVTALHETPLLGLGVHLNLTMGRPISAPETVSSAIDEKGNFFKYIPFVENLPRLNVNEVKAEWRAQIETFIKAAGRLPTHLDSHHHSSFITPSLFRGMLELAKEYDCAIRFPFSNNVPGELEETFKEIPNLMKEFNPRHPDVFIDDFYDEKVTQAQLRGIINNVGTGSTEIMCHPGYVDEAFAQESAYNWQRVTELNILTDPTTKQAIQLCNIELITFAKL
jgi:predicted glycoside hydrolase/deacetylase ChbG (UPF0249 family)